MEFGDYIIYVDESGDHSLVHTNPNYPIFALAFCIFAKRDYVSEVVPSLQSLKFQWFGHDAFIFHEREMRKRKRPFDVLVPKARYSDFMAEIAALVEAAPMTVVAAVIKKDALKAQYVLPDNPYELALKFCMERTALFLREFGQSDKLTHIIVERRGAQEDRDLELEFRRICAGRNMVGKLENLDILFVDKKANSTGLQIADLFARPIGLSVLRPGQENRAFELIEKKFRRNSAGNSRGYGFKEFP